MKYTFRMLLSGWQRKMIRPEIVQAIQKGNGSVVLNLFLPVVKGLAVGEKKKKENIINKSKWI